MWRRRTSLLTVASLVAIASRAEAQTSTQLWGTVTLDWIKSRAVTIGVELEPKLLVSRASDEPGWATLDATPSIELSHGNWLDATGELLIARTRQTDHLVTTEVTPRIGF